MVHVATTAMIATMKSIKRSNVIIEIKDIIQNEADHLLEKSAALMAALYPAHSNHLADKEQLFADNNIFIGAYIEKNTVGCIALVNKKTYAEIKSLFVDKEYRGQKIAEQLMAEIENRAQNTNIKTLRLETGIDQPVAIKLYEKIGYQKISPFGEYAEDPLSVFMEKTI